MPTDVSVDERRVRQYYKDNNNVNNTIFYSPEILKLILSNPMINLHVIDSESGVNCFWIAAFYGHGNNMSVLAEKGIDIFNKNL